MHSFPVLYSASLYVSFRPSSLHSHSRSTSAYLPLSIPVFSLSLQFLSSLSCPVLTTQLSASSVPCFLLPPHSGFHNASLPLSLPRFPRILLTGFPFRPFRFPYLAFCLFPFALPCFAPTAVPQVITFFRLSTSLRCRSMLPLSFVRFRLGSIYSASAFSFPSSRFSHRSWYIRGTYPSSVPPVSTLRFRLWYSALLQFLSPIDCFRITGATTAPNLLFPARSFPLASP